MKFSAAILILVNFVFIESLFAQKSSEDEILGRPTFGNSGKLLSVQYDSNQKQVLLDVAGKTASRFDLKSKNVEVLGYLLNGSEPPKPVTLVQVGSAYRVNEPVEKGSTIEVKVRNKETGQSEAHKFKVP